MLGGERPAKYVLPKQYTADEQWPLLLLLHGYSANIGNPELSGGDIQDGYLGLSQRSSELGFIMLIPHGTLDSKNNQFWNATDYCCDFEKNGVDDVTYLTGLLDEAATYFNVDPKRVYLLGHSNGGFMSYRLACAAGERFAALASIAGTSYWDATKCTPASSPISVLQIHGTADTSIKYDGITGAFCSADEVVQRWVQRNACEGNGEAGTALDIVSGDNAAETNVTRWSQCADDTVVELWSMDGIGHIPGFTSDFSAAALDFLLSKKRP